MCLIFWNFEQNLLHNLTDDASDKLSGELQSVKPDTLKYCFQILVLDLSFYVS